MKVATAMICLDCDCVFEGEVCPDCAGRKAIPLARYFQPIPREKEKNIEKDSEAQSNKH